MEDKQGSDEQTTEAQETSGESAEAEGTLEPQAIGMTERVKAVLPIVYSVVSVGTLGVLIWQGGNIQRQTNILGQNAAALSTTVEVSRNAQRAWVNSTGIARFYLNEDSRLVAHVLLENRGQTPARNVTSTGTFDLVEKGNPPKLTYGDSRYSVAVLLPGQDTTSRAYDEDGVTNREVAEIRSGEKDLYLYGKITYNHVFDDSSHHTEYCYQLDDWDPDSGSSKWRLHSQYNEAD